MDVDVDLIGWVGVGLGGTYGCRCGILYAPMLGIVVYASDIFFLFFSLFSLFFGTYCSRRVFFFWSASFTLCLITLRKQVYDNYGCICIFNNNNIFSPICYISIISHISVTSTAMLNYPTTNHPCFISTFL